ncbi:hypothetical protein [Novosphingobium cyanobacteriorum]|uniref:Cadherin domain-containing protein n=1 Tax=Novosphingobium cyanobacteriorum TaxID=3024215 RepID=A0ABT6CPI5_9SPHN|nr:hypothetical protein [Novosphingobium cyanobacteriorum]MDF8335010.1 hypothetical protein [Novosphingobium cyanobacteriorum]
MTDVLQLQAGANESDIAHALALLPNGGTLILPENETIQIVDGLKIDVTNRDINLVLNGSTLVQAGNSSVITASGSITNTQSVGLDISGDNAKITFSGNISNLKVGDWIKVVSDDVLPFDNRNTAEPTRLGQAMQIVAINGNTVEVAGKPLYADQYVTNVRAGEISSGQIKISDGTVMGDQSHIDWNSDLINIRNAIAPEISHVTVRDGNSMGMNFVNTVNALVQDSAAINLLDDIPLGHYGYGVHSASSVNTTVIGLYAERVRHATDDNGVVSGINNPNLSAYGADIGLHVKDTVSYYASAFSYSFHSEGRNGLLENVMSFESHGFVGFRGVGHQLINSGSVGDERGFQYMEYGYGDSRDTVVDNTIVREAGRYIYVVSGDPTNNVIKNSSLEYDLRDGNLGTTQLINTIVIRWNGVDDNIFLGSEQGDRLLGGRGVDTINGAGGDDYIWGGDGIDTLTGGAGKDRFVFDHLDSIDIITDFQAGAGGDTLDVSILGARHGWRGDFLAKGYVQFVQSGADTLVKIAPEPGGDLFTIARLQNVSAADLTADNLQMFLSGGSTPTATPVPTGTVPTGSVAYKKGVKIVGTTGNDYIDATHSVPGQPLPTNGADSISTNAGDDFIDGLGGADTINAGAGNDTVVYYQGVAASLQGGSGRDTLVLFNTTDFIDLSQSDQTSGLANVSGFDDVDGRGSTIGLYITGNSANNNLWGGSGDDIIDGGDGNDSIDGGDGNDVLALEGNRDDYAFIRINANTWRVQDLSGNLPFRDYVRNIERVSFEDQTSFIDVLNRPPSDVLLSAQAVQEGLATGTVVGAFTGVDPDVSEINTWTLLDDAGGRFALVGNQLVTTGVFDYENDPNTFTVTVMLTDSDGHNFTKTFDIAIADVNDVAPVINSAATVTVAENETLAQVLTAVDADTTGETLTFSVDPTTGDGALFTIVNGNELRFVNPPDFENVDHAPSYTVSVIVSDGIQSTRQTITVNVSDVKAGDTLLGTSGADIFGYASSLTYDGVDGLDGIDTLKAAVSASGGWISANGAMATLDLNGDGAVDFRAINVEKLVLTGNNVAFQSSLAGTGVTDVSIAGTSAADQFDGSLAGVKLMLSGAFGDDVLIGGSAADILDGGMGNDQMIGGGGDDTYIVDSALDQVTEASGAGFDTVQTALNTYTLGINVEALVFTGSRNFTGKGNALDNLIIGGSGNDRIEGGAGADTMIGGSGGDTYVVDNVNDIVVENANAGNDRVLSTVSYTLSDNVEGLTLTTSMSLSGTGNAIANSIIGNGGANILDGRGGADTLTGGAGNDTFAFQRGEAAGDVVTDFTGAGVAGGDVLRFVGFGADAYLTHDAGSDIYEIHAGAAFGGIVETIQLVGVTNLDSGDYLFV